MKEEDIAMAKAINAENKDSPAPLRWVLVIEILDWRVWIVLKEEIKSKMDKVVYDEICNKSYQRQIQLW